MFLRSFYLIGFCWLSLPTLSASEFDTAELLDKVQKQYVALQSVEIATFEKGCTRDFRITTSRKELLSCAAKLPQLIDERQLQLVSLSFSETKGIYKGLILDSKGVPRFYLTSLLAQSDRGWQLDGLAIFPYCAAALGTKSLRHSTLLACQCQRKQRE